MKISLLHPSRSRPEKSLNNSIEWTKNAGCEVELILSLDNSDPSLLTYQRLYFDSNDIHPKTGLFITVNHNSNVVQATNHAARIATGDILVYLSDDFKCFEGWGQAVIKEFQNEHRPLLIKVDDCLQGFGVPVLTIPIMNRALYERLGYFWHPGYRSMFVDCDLYWTVRKLGALKFSQHLKFPHEHPANGKAEDDETYRRSSANWNQGETLFNQRKLQGFPL